MTGLYEVENWTRQTCPKFNLTRQTTQKNPKSNLTRQKLKLKFWKKNPKNQGILKIEKLKYWKIQVWNWPENLENWKIEKSRDQSDPKIPGTLRNSVPQEYFDFDFEFDLVL